MLDHRLGLGLQPDGVMDLKQEERAVRSLTMMDGWMKDGRRFLLLIQRSEVFRMMPRCL